MNEKLEKLIDELLKYQKTGKIINHLEQAQILISKHKQIKKIEL